MPHVLHLAKDPQKFIMPHIITRTDEETKKAFRAVAKKRGITESKLLDELIASAIRAKPGAQIADDPEPVKPTAESIEPARINIRLPAFLLDGAKQRAESKAMSTNRWVVALLQTHLTQKPVMTDYQVAMLKGSGRELAAIGRNMNQIARALHESSHETDRMKLKLLEDLAAEIKVNRQMISDLVRASLHAWSFDGSQ